MNETTQILLLTIFGVFLITACMGLGLTIGWFFGRRRQRRCACAEAKRVARLIEERKKVAREAQHYSPETVDPNALPTIDAEIVGRN